MYVHLQHLLLLCNRAEYFWKSMKGAIIKQCTNEYFEINCCPGLLKFPKRFFSLKAQWITALSFICEDFDESG